MKVFKKTRRPEPFANSKREAESTDLPMQTPKSAIWGWLELGFTVALASSVVVSILQVLFVAAEGVVD